MFIEDTFNCELLGFKEEEKILDYDGWVIFARIYAQSKPELIDKIKHILAVIAFGSIKETMNIF